MVEDLVEIALQKNDQPFGQIPNTPINSGATPPTSNYSDNQGYSKPEEEESKPKLEASYQDPDNKEHNNNNKNQPWLVRNALELLSLLHNLPKNPKNWL